MMTVYYIKNEAGLYLNGGLLSLPSWDVKGKDTLAYPTFEHASSAKALLRIHLDLIGRESSATTARMAKPERAEILPYGFDEWQAWESLKAGMLYVLPLYVDGAPAFLLNAKEVTA